MNDFTYIGAKNQIQIYFVYDQRKLSDWRIKQTAVDALLAAGLPIPSELSWVHDSPPTKKKIINHGLEIDYVVVNEE